MMKIKNIILMMVAMALLVACSSDNNEATGEGMVPINLTISPKAVSTRTATTDIQSAQLASGQTFYAYFTSADVVPRSSTFTADGAGGTTPASQPYFKLSETSTGVRAYYPSSVTEETTSFTVEANQSGDDAYRASDLMFASANITKVFPASTGALTFAHKMAKIKVTTTTRVSSIKTIKLKGILPTVPFNASDGTLGTASGSATDITMYSHSGQTANINCVALIPPQSKAADATLIEVTSALHSSTPLTYKLPNAITFQSGLQYIFNVDLHEEQLVVTCTVSAWGDGNTDATAISVKRDQWMNPLWYVAENNVKSYNSSTKVVTFETNPAAAGSKTVYSWADAMSNFAKQTTSYTDYWLGNITDGMSSYKYHLPTLKEYLSVCYLSSNIFNTEYISGGGLVSTASICSFGYNSETMEGVEDWTYWSTYSANSNLRYAIRFLGTPYCSVWKYQFSGNTLTITVKLIPIVSKNDNSLSALLNYYMGLSATWWNTNNENDGAVQRKFYAAGSKDSGSGTSDSYVDTSGSYWSTVEIENTYARALAFFDNYTGIGNSLKTHGYSIRLFRNSDDRGYDPGVSLSSSSIQLGWVVAANGKVYQTLALANQFSTAVAMVAYIGSASDCSHGLAYALTDMGPMYRAAAATSVNGYTPVVAGGSWRLPTKTDYKYMFAACGGSPIGTADGASQSYNYGNFRTLLQGVNADVLNVRYWTSTAQASDLLWDYDFSGKYFYYNDIHNGYVRAVLAF